MKHTLSRMGLMIILIAFSLGMSAQSRTEKLIRKIISSEMMRYREAWMIDSSKGPKWNYTQGLELKAMMDYADTQDRAYRSMIYSYADTYADTLISENGRIFNYRMDEYKLDAINSGKLLFRLYRFTHKPQYRMAMDTLRRQLTLQPRTENGGFWHKQIYPEQMWLDGLYMGAPFYAEYAWTFERGETRAVSLDDVEHQFCTIYNHTYCSKCNLLHHAWDADTVQIWADKSSGRSEHAWGRAEGWYLMALVDYLGMHKENSLKYYSQDQGSVDSLSYILKSLCFRMLELQDPQKGAWRQVLDCPEREDNYLEMSVTSMMAYTYLKAYRLGYLGEEYRKAAVRALNGMRKYFCYEDEEGGIHLKDVCIVAGLSDTRNGSYEYYIGERRGEDDPKALGPWIMALTELHKLEKKK